MTKTTYKPKVHFSGPISFMSGYGEHARYILRFLLRNIEKYDLYLTPTQWANSTHSFSAFFSPSECDEIISIIRKTAKYADKLQTKAAFKFDLSLQVSVPNEWQHGIADKTIGITAGIETNCMRGDWLNYMRPCDEIWVVSKHSKFSALKTIDIQRETQGKVWGSAGEMPEQASGIEAFMKEMIKKIKVYGFPVRQSNDIKRADILKDVTTKFNFLSINQIGPRKNVEQLIKEFIEEFKDNSDVGLILKSHMNNHSIPDKYLCEKILKEHIKRQLSVTSSDYKCKIYLLHGNLKEDEVRSLLIDDKVKAYVSTTHGEGFGLPLFEAACAGLPIAAPAWSGHMDFLSMNDTKGYLFERIPYDLKDVGVKADGNFLFTDMKWAHPREGATRKALRACYEKNHIKKKQAEKLMSLIKESNKFNEEHIEKKMIATIDSMVGAYDKSYSARKTESLLQTLDFEE